MRPLASEDANSSLVQTKLHIGFTYPSLRPLLGLCRLLFRKL